MPHRVEGLVQGAHLPGEDTADPLKMEATVEVTLGRETATVGPRPPEEEEEETVDLVSWILSRAYGACIEGQRNPGSLVPRLLTGVGRRTVW